MRQFKDEKDKKLYYQDYQNDSLDQLFEEYLWLDAEDLLDLDNEIYFSLDLPCNLKRLIYGTNTLRTKILNNLYKENNSDLDIEQFYMLILLCMGFYILKIVDDKNKKYYNIIADKKSELISYLDRYAITHNIPKNLIKSQILEP